MKRNKKNLIKWGGLGGSKKSKLKARMARLNGKKGGRPKGSKNKPKSKVKK